MNDLEKIKDDLSTKNVLVAGVARDCGRTVRADILKLRASLSSFGAVRYLVIESDSTDDTIQQLEALESELDNFRFISLGKLKPKITWHTMRLAHCRNKYLDELTDNPLYSDIDYVIISDLDGMNGLLTEQGVLSCWTRDDWDVCTANQKGYYYDLWALRHPKLYPYDLLIERDRLMANGWAEHIAYFEVCYSKKTDFDENAEMMEVDSAFGGLGIYRKEALVGVRYSGWSESNKICEHVPLNYQIKAAGGHIFINPKLVNRYSKKTFLSLRFKIQTFYCRLPQPKWLRKMVAPVMVESRIAKLIYGLKPKYFAISARISLYLGRFAKRAT